MRRWSLGSVSADCVLCQPQYPSSNARSQRGCDRKEAPRGCEKKEAGRARRACLSEEARGGLVRTAVTTNRSRGKRPTAVAASVQPQSRSSPCWCRDGLQAQARGSLTTVASASPAETLALPRVYGLGWSTCLKGASPRDRLSQMTGGPPPGATACHL